MISCNQCTRTFKGQQEYDNHLELHKPVLQRPCWDCEVREAVPNERYCAECEAKAQWIADFYDQYKD